jgi:Bacterial Ig-like domain
MPNRRISSSRRKATVALLGLALVSQVLAPGPAAAAETGPSFCQGKTLHDYRAWLKRMPKLRELPYRRIAEPLFRGVRIGAAGPSLAVNGGRAGYQLQWDRNPKWEITVELARVNARGDVIRRIGQRRRQLGRLAPALITEPGFTMPGRPAFYRSTLSIRAASGRKLAEFGNYYRVIRPTVHNRLTLDGASYRPGDTLFARIENPGASFVLSGEEFEVEMLDGNSWVPAPESPGPFPTPLYFVAPGTTGNNCTVLALPAAVPAGRYRISQETVLSWPYQRRERRPTLHAEFEVVPETSPPL